ncbi:MAG TPA: serine/threonine-protein kinase, partial [Pirellulaceae bacterium]
MSAESLERNEDEADLSDDELARPVQDLIRRVRRGQGSATAPAFDVETNAAAGDTPQTNDRTSRTPVERVDRASSHGGDRADESSANNDTLGAGMAAAAIGQDLPTRIGRFVIESVLGRGGFGIVFLAHDPELDRQVALKIPRLDALASSDGQVRFLREAKAAALLGHPNIVTVYEAGQVGPVLFIAFEWIDGPTLSQWLAEQPTRLEPDTSAKLVMTLAEAVDHAHRRGIIHRDLKPQNVLIQVGSPRSAEPASSLYQRSKISDFGMARVLDDDGHRTHSGAIVGTPIYMAPEQANVSVGPI